MEFVLLMPLLTNYVEFTGRIIKKRGYLRQVDFRSRDRKLRAENFLYVEKTKTMLVEQGKLLIEILRPTFYKFIFTFPALTFHDFLLAPQQNIYISAK
jgi:hypothetical protein